MSDAPGPGWWRASDGRWYPPPQPGAGDQTDVMPQPTPTPTPPAPAAPAQPLPPPVPNHRVPGGAAAPGGPAYAPIPGRPVTAGAHAPARPAAGTLRGGARAVIVIGGVLFAVVLVTGEVGRTFFGDLVGVDLLFEVVAGIGGLRFTAADLGAGSRDLSQRLLQVSTLTGIATLVLGTVGLFLAARRARSARALAVTTGVLGLVTVALDIVGTQVDATGFVTFRELYASTSRPFIGPLLLFTVASLLVLVGGLLPRRR